MAHVFLLMADILGDKKKIFIFGARGFIGSNLSNYLIEEGYSVIGYALEDRPAGVGFEKYYQKNLSEDIDLTDKLQGVDAVIYLISTTTPSTSMDDINRAYVCDIPMFLKVINAAKDAGVKRVIFASSGGTIYGLSNTPKKESDATHPLCNYGISKLACENILLMYNNLYSMENIILRISNPFGFGQNLASGVGVVTAFANAAKENEQLTVIGDTATVRDLIPISYVLEAFLSAVNYDNRTNEIPVFNIGSGVGVSISQLLNITEEVFKEDLSVNHLPKRDFDLDYSVLNVDKAEALLEYRPPEDIYSEITNYVRRIKDL